MFIEIFKDLLSEKNLNPAEFSRRIQIPYSTIRGWLTLGRLPDFEALTKLANYFDISLDYLCGRTTDISFKDEYQPRTKYKTKRLIELFEQLDTYTQSEIIGYVAAYVEHQTKRIN